MTLQKKATVVSSSVAAFLTLIKLAIGIMSGSVAVLASAVDSILDMFVSLFNYFAISNSEKPADKYFNYGRGKIEALASVIEGAIITLSGLFLLNAVAKKTNNMVIKADALHYKTDVWVNAAVLISLILVYFTGYEIVDIIIGGGISIFIIYSAYELIEDGILILLDRALPEEMAKNIEIVFQKNSDINDYHDLKTRNVSDNNYVDVHLVFDCIITLMAAHKISDKIEDKIRVLDTDKNWIINIHMDPYDDSEINNQENSIIKSK